jgi:O-acetylhomoserine (thiol)-lyase
MHSATKWLGGHGVAIGGIVTDGGRFDWRASGKFPTLSEPYDGYLGVTYADTFGPAAFSARARTEGVRDFGACLSPQNAFYILQGIETLPLRMQRHVASAAAVLEFLGHHPAVAYVRHPSLPDHPDHELAKRLLPKGAGSIISFGVKGGRAAGARFIEACRLASHLANVGDAKTLVIHPASTTHLQLGEAQLEAAGLRDDMIRLSVGLEDPADILDDLGRALRAAARG